MPASQIPIGMKGEHTITVGSDIAISFLGVEDGRRVLATPALIMNLEMASRNSIKPFPRR